MLVLVLGDVCCCGPQIPLVRYVIPKPAEQWMYRHITYLG